jgi:ATP-binding protein involved in chromosome partitioning
MPIHGLVENMSYLCCPDCGKTIHVFGRGGGEEMALEAHVPLLGQIPLEPEVVRAGDNGRPLALHSRLEDPGVEQCATARAFLSLAQKLVQDVEAEASPWCGQRAPEREAAVSEEHTAQGGRTPSAPRA